MTREERLDWLCRLRSGLVWFDVPPKERPVFEQVLSEVIKDLEQEPCEDAVSRKEIKEAIMKCETISEDSMDGYIDSTTKLEVEIDCIPSVTPTRKKGKWIINKERDTICCPYCHDKQKIGKEEVELLKTAFAGFRFCKYCGAEMESEAESEE